MSDIKITKPRLRLVIEHPETEQLVSIDVQTDNRDAVRYDRLRGVKHFPAVEDAPFLWMSVLGWSAIARSDLGDEFAPIAKIKLDAFLDDQLVDVVMIDEYGNAIETDAQGNPVDPAAPVEARPTSAETDSA